MFSLASAITGSVMRCSARREKASTVCALVRIAMGCDGGPLNHRYYTLQTHKVYYLWLSTVHCTVHCTQL